MSRRFYLIASAVFLVGFANTASAQFAGDVFFETPSVAAAPGEVAELSLTTFSGAEVFGAAQLQLTWPEDQLTLVDIVPSAVFSDNGGFVVESAPGTSAFVLGNASSLESPIGTTTLLTIRFRVDATEGTVVPIDAFIDGYLFSDGTESLTGTALGAEIVASSNIVASSQASLADGSPAILFLQEGEPLHDRAIRLRQPGSELMLLVVEGNTVAETAVKVAPAEATPSD